MNASYVFKGEYYLLLIGLMCTLYGISSYLAIAVFSQNNKKLSLI